MVDPNSHQATIYAGQSKIIILEIMNYYSGAPIAGVDVDFNWNNSVYTNTTGQNGYAYFDLGVLEEGVYSLNATVDNDDYYLDGMAFYTLNVIKQDSSLYVNRFDEGK